MFAINHPIPRGYWPRNSFTNQWNSQPLWSDALCLPSSSPQLCPLRRRLKDTWHMGITPAWLKAFCQAIWGWVEALEGERCFELKHASSCHWVTHKWDPLNHIPPLRYSSAGSIGECQSAPGSLLRTIIFSPDSFPWLHSKERKTNKAC